MPPAASVRTLDPNGLTSLNLKGQTTDHIGSGILLNGDRYYSNFARR